MTEREPILVEREKTHGDFGELSNLVNDLLDILNKARQGKPYPRPEHREAISMIIRKISRIICGNYDFKDHWNDIAGYAKLGAEVCDDNK